MYSHAINDEEIATMSSTNLSRNQYYCSKDEWT